MVEMDTSLPRGTLNSDLTILSVTLVYIKAANRRRKKVVNTERKRKRERERERERER